MNGDVLFENTENCLTMAAGSDPQPVESSVVPDHSKPGLITSISLTRIAGVRNIPYSDHNYGKPLTPPDSCSPEHPEEADTGNEEEGFTRCICGFKHDDGYMICCDKCSAWQHVECVGIKSNSVPETYLCDECDPRPLDKERAKQIQTKKIEDPTDEEEEEDGDVSDHDSDNNGLRITLPNPASIKENILTKGKRKKRDSTRKLGQKEIKHNKRKRRKRKHISSEAIPVDEDTNGPWSLSPFPGLSPEKYQEAHTTVYIGDLDEQAFSLAESQMKSASCLKPEQLCKVVEVQKNKKGVVVTEDINTEKFIIECKGNLMLESKFKEENPMFPKCHPFILYYNKLDHLRLVMNFGSYGNDARFIRRSCSPTAEVRHVVVESQIRLFIVSVTPLAKGSEVTVAFEFPFHEYRHQLECACAQESCTVQKHNVAIQRVEPPNGYGNKDEHHGLSLIDSSLSNHVGFHLMDSDSEGDNSNEAKDKRSRKKLSREERKLQQYLRQIDKMEKTEKKKQQSNGRDARTGILTQRNLADDFNCDTPSKPGKGFSTRKPSLSQRYQRKIPAIVRRTHRLPSCSSEPLSPEDNYSSTASTPTTPSVNVVEEQNDVHHHHHEAAEKSFKFPKFKKGSLNDVSTSNCDLTRSNDASPEAGYTSPSKSSFEARLVEVEVSEPVTLVDCERIPNLEQTPVNGCSSPRTDPNCSPSPCHSTYASPTRSESVDFSDAAFRHCLASPTAGSVASYLLNQKTLESSYCHTTLKKRWLLKYMSENTPDKRPNGLVSTNSMKPNYIIRACSPRTFPLPYKRRKLLEYRNTVNNGPLFRTNVTTVSQTVDNDTALQALSSAISGSVSSISSVSPTLLTPSLCNGVMSVTSSDVRDSISQHSSPIPRNTAGCDETGSERSSLSSISSTEDIKSDLTLTETRMETNSSVTVDSSTGCVIKPLSCNVLSSTQSVEDTSLDVSTNGVAAGDEGSSRDTMAHVGSTIECSGHTTTAGGKKKVSLSEYLNRKRTSTPAGKKESCPASSSEVSSPSQSRVLETTSVSLSTDPVSSAVNYRSLNCSSSSTSSAYGTTPSQSRVSATTSVALSVDPVSSAMNYRPLSCNGSTSSTYGTTPSQSRVSATTSAALSADVVSSAVNYRLLSCSSSTSSTYETTPSQSRVSATTNAALSTDVVSSAVSYRSLSYSNNSTSTTYGTTLLSSSVSSSTGGVLIEPVSPDEGYRVDDDRPLLHTTQDLRSSLVVREAKPSVVRDSYFNSLTRPVRPVSEPGSSSDAMDIEEDDAPSSSTILVNTPVMSAPGGGPIARSSLSGLGTNYSPLHQVKLNNVSSAQSTAVHQINDTLVSPDTLRRRPGLITARIPNPSMQAVARHQDFHCASSRPTPFH